MRQGPEMLYAEPYDPERRERKKKKSERKREGGEKRDPAERMSREHGASTACACSSSGVTAPRSGFFP